MNSKPTKSTFIMRAAVTLLLTVFTTIGTWAQTKVKTEEQLTDAITNGANIQLTGDIQLSKYLSINGITVTIDLNGHRLYRELDSSFDNGHIFWVYANGNVSGNLTIDDSSTAKSGTIEGGNATNGGGINIWPGCSLTINGGTFKNNSARDCGGAIFVRNGATVTINNASFIGNSAGDHGGAVWNNGTFTATNCTFENNTAKDVGGIYDSVSDDGTTAGTATLTGCTFKGNKGTTGAGALANALGATEMTIDGGTIQNNTAGSNGGAGIWNGGTLNMKGAITVQDNTNVSGVLSNVYLKSGKVITVTGSLNGSSIGIDLESLTGTFTSGFSDYNSGVDPSTLFTADRPIVSLGFSDGEACLTSISNNAVSYIERSWDDTNKKVVSTENVLAEGQYKEVTNAPSSTPNEWFGMGSPNASVAEYYVVRGNVNRETIVVQGKNVHLILCDGAMLTLTGGLKLEGDNKLYIHCQSYGDKMGRLMVTNSYDYAAGIGSALDKGNVKEVGELVIYGGHIEATGGDYGAGIGSCGAEEKNDKRLCNKVTVYGGFVEAHGGKEAAGIGGGVRIHGGEFILYDGIVIARGKGSGIGSGFRCDSGGNVTVYGGSLTASDVNGAGIGGTVTISGGTVTATGGGYSAGIGGAKLGNGESVTISGGTVTATGAENAAGIGGGFGGNGGDVTITGGTVTAIGGTYAAGIGGGWYNDGGNVTITGGMVTAIGAIYGAGIGGGWKGKGGNVTITGGTVIAKNQSKVESRAIGPGYDCDKFGTLTIGDAIMVGAGNNGSVERIYDADERVNACWYRSYAEISPCTHPSGITYTINDGGTHSSHCKHCAVSETAAHFNSDGSGTCICGYNDGEEYHTITIATSSGTYYEGVGEVVKVGKDKPYTLPVCSIIPEGYDFAGWVVNPQSHDNGIRPNDGETLRQAGEDITVTGNVSIFARYQALEISLADDGDNDEKLYTYNGRKAASVTLTGRKLWKDGEWNTLCLPFALSDGDETDGITFSGTLLEGAMVLTLDNATYGDSTLMLNFKEVTAMEPGKPYLVKWANDTEQPAIVNPVFNGVTISNTSTSENAVVAGIVTFKGQYAPLNVGKYDEDIIFYLGSGNTFYFPNDSMTIGSCRAYLQINTNLGDVNGDGTISVSDVTLLVSHILGVSNDNFIIENADVNGDGNISVSDVTVLVNIILGDNSVIDVVVNGADGLTFGAYGSVPARVSRK